LLWEGRDLTVAEKGGTGGLLKELGFLAEPTSSFAFVIPSRPEPRSRGEDDEESAFFRSL
jgi:hypothetical protein